MKIKSYTLNFIALGKAKKIYLRYYANKQTLNVPCDLVLTAADLEKLNNGTLGGSIQRFCYQIRQKYVNIIEVLNVRDNSYPTPIKIKEYLNVTEKELEIEYIINQYMHSLTCKSSTKKNYGYVLHIFIKFYNYKFEKLSIKQLCNKQTIIDFERYLLNRRKIDEKLQAKISIHNDKRIILSFLNYIADEYHLKKVEIKLIQPKYSLKWHLNSVDIDRLLEYKSITSNEQDVLDIITINRFIGLRISELLNIEPENITIYKDYVQIKFIEEKKNRERSVIIVDKISLNIINERLSQSPFWSIKTYSVFDVILKKIAKNVFKEEKVKIYQVNTFKSGYVNVLKCEAISSHALRRYAAATNISKYGIEFARSMGGWSDYQVITKNYSEFMKVNDMKNTLLKK